MTCIVGLVDEGTVYIGGDSAGTSGWDLILRADQKIFRLGPYLLGFTTSFRMGQLLRYSLTVPRRNQDASDERHMATAFIDAVRECLKAGGYATVLNNREEGGAFIVGYRGRLYVIDSDYQVMCPAEPFAAVGCGGQIAHGALYASRDKPPLVRVQLALEAAERFSAPVRAPFVIETLPAGDVWS